MAGTLNPQGDPINHINPVGTNGEYKCPLSLEGEG
jgi:hypothetical protein